MTRRFALLGLVIALIFLGIVLERSGATKMAKKTTYYLTKEPMLISGTTDDKNFYMIPAGTPMYFDKAFNEGHQRYIIYANFKGNLQAEEINSDKSNLIDPVWLYQIDKEDVTKLIQKYPLSKADLLNILKARSITRDELAQIVREWKD